MPVRLDWAIMGLALILNACATTDSGPHATYDFSKIQRMTVMPLEGTGGSEATDEFVRQIVGTGLAVSDAHHPGEVMLRGTVTEYKASTPLMVFLGNTALVASNGQTITVDNPVVAQAGSLGVSETVSPEAHHAQVVSVVATVGIDAVLVDASTHAMLWRGSQTYEGLDLAGTLQTAVRQLTRSLAMIIPRMRQKSL